MSIYKLKSEYYTLENWNKVQPVREITLLGKTFYLTQPSSTFLVYFLGLQTCYLAFLYYPINIYWFLAYLFWGVGAIVAGTSYQAFFYYLKVKNQKKVLWTSWWEVVYMFLQKISFNFMAFAYIENFQLFDNYHNEFKLFILLEGFLFLVLLIYGSAKPIKRLISFEFMWQYSLCLISLLFCSNVYGYLINKKNDHLFYLYFWSLLFVILFTYYLYSWSDLTNKLWKRKIWFSDNDWLHITLILWVFFIMKY